MKNIILVSILLVFNLSIYANAENIELSPAKISEIENKQDLNVQTYLDEKKLIEKIISTSLKDIKLEKDEFIRFYGDYSYDKKIKTIEIDAYNISDEKAVLITKNIQKIIFTNEINQANLPEFDKYTLLILPQPKYKENTIPNVCFYMFESQKKAKYQQYGLKKRLTFPENKLTPNENLDEIVYDITIDKNGKIISVHLLNSSGDEKYDLEALKLIDPVIFSPPIEQGLNIANSTIVFNYKYKVKNKLLKSNLNLPRHSSVILSVVLNQKGDVIEINTTKKHTPTLIDEVYINTIKKMNFAELLKYQAAKEKMFYFKISQLGYGEEVYDIRIAKNYLEFENGAKLWNSYIQNFQNKIRKNWNARIVAKNNFAEPKYFQIQTLIIIGKNGENLKTKITKSSGNPKIDEEALQAIYDSEPFEPLPKEFEGKEIPMEFTFEYNIPRPKNNYLYSNQPHDGNSNKPKSKYRQLIEQEKLRQYTTGKI